MLRLSPRFFVSYGLLNIVASIARFAAAFLTDHFGQPVIQK
jgi:hypothetical protein